MDFTGDVFTRVGGLRRDKNILEENGTSLGVLTAMCKNVTCAMYACMYACRGGGCICV